MTCISAIEIAVVKLFTLRTHAHTNTHMQERWVLSLLTSALKGDRWKTYPCSYAEDDTTLNERLANYIKHFARNEFVTVKISI